MESNFGMYGEGKVDRCRALRQLDDVSGRREDEDLILIKIQLQKLEEFVGSLCIELELQHLSEPLKRAVELVSASRIFLEPPVRRDSVLGGAMHLACANLNLEQLPIRTEHRGVKRLISV